MDSLQPVHWTLLCAVGMLAGSLFMLAMSHRSIERRARAIDEAMSAAEAETRRAHVRLDNHERHIQALGKELGWADDRAHTRVLTERPPP